jgi:hypothetical protein
MKHNIEDCKIKLRAIHKIAQIIIDGAGELDDIVVITLAQQIQQDTELLSREDDSN